MLISPDRQWHWLQRKVTGELTIGERRTTGEWRVFGRSGYIQERVIKARYTIGQIIKPKETRA